MRRSKKGLIMGIVVIVVIALIFAGCNIYRYPAIIQYGLRTKI